MFIGAINQDLRCVVSEAVKGWDKGAGVYVPCSGNFTIERILCGAGFREVHGNDVSLYSCALGALLSGEDIRVEVADQEFDWLREYLTPGVGTIATLMLCTKIFPFCGRKEPYHKRMLRAYRAKWPELYAATMERVEKATQGVRLASFMSGDALDFLKEAPEDAGVISFPPTYAGGYEKLYKRFEEVFDWDRPEYTPFTAESFVEMVDAVVNRKAWILIRDEEYEDLAGNLVARVQTGARSKPVYVYSGGCETARVTMPRQKIETLIVPRLGDEMEPPMSIIELTQGQFNFIRSQYLSAKIIPASANVRLAFLVGGRLIGSAAFSRATYGRDSAYMMTDFAIRPTRFKRLSKLVLCGVLSREVQAVLSQRLGQRVTQITTTAFTDNAVSMKYRGLFEMLARKDGFVNYGADAGRWSLEEGLTWWRSKFEKA